MSFCLGIFLPNLTQAGLIPRYLGYRPSHLAPPCMTWPAGIIGCLHTYGACFQYWSRSSSVITSWFPLRFRALLPQKYSFTPTNGCECPRGWRPYFHHMCLTHVRILFMSWFHDIITRAWVMTYILKNTSLHQKNFIIGKGRSWCYYYFLIPPTCFSTLSTWSCHYLAGIRQVIPSIQDPFTPYFNIACDTIFKSPHVSIQNGCTKLIVQWMHPQNDTAKFASLYFLVSFLILFPTMYLP